MTDLTIDAPVVLTAPGAARISGLRGLRYGEVLLVHENDGNFSADVWNSMGLNDCPQQAWDELDAEAIAREHDGLLALLNGPRHWLMDVIENVPRTDRRVERFGSLDMTLVASVDLGTELPALGPYTERTVLRDTVWEWSSGRTVHELRAPDGRVYVMQAYCLAVDPTLDESSLSGLAARLDLPAGWTLTSRTLDDVLRLRAPDGVAVVIQDELQNTYMAA